MLLTDEDACDGLCTHCIQAQLLLPAQPAMHRVSGHVRTSSVNHQLAYTGLLHKLLYLAKVITLAY